MAVVAAPGPMEAPMMANSGAGRCTAKGLALGPAAESILASGEMGSHMEKGSFIEKVGSMQQGILHVDGVNVVALEGSADDAGGSEGGPDHASRALVRPTMLAASSEDASLARPKAPKKNWNKIP